MMNCCLYSNPNEEFREKSFEKEKSWDKNHWNLSYVISIHYKIDVIRCNLMFSQSIDIIIRKLKKNEILLIEEILFTNFE